MRERIAEVGCGHKEVDEEQFAITPVGSDLRVAVRPFPSWRPGNPCWSLVGSIFTLGHFLDCESLKGL